VFLLFYRLYLAARRAQTPVVLPATLVVVGGCALVLGSGVSKAFTTLGGNVTPRIMGVLLVVGGLLTVSSIVRASPLREVLGLTLAVFGAAIYAAAVIIGLGTQGLVAGVGYTGITLTLLSRVFFVVHMARVADPADATRA